MSAENVQVVRHWMEGLIEEGMPPLHLCDERIEIGTSRSSWSKATTTAMPEYAGG